jgi:hypothetical protein
MDLPDKPWSLAQFEEYRSHLTGFVRSRIVPLLESKKCRRILIRAPVKCGKREIVEYISTRDLVDNPPRVHAFVSAWHRNADEDQRTELRTQNISVFSITSTQNVLHFLRWVEQQFTQGKSIVIHLDECEYGSGSNQMLSKVWTKIRDSDKVTTILYSATPEEVLFSNEVDDEAYVSILDDIGEGERVEYTPPDGYCGPKRFLDEGLVHDAIPFFEKKDAKYTMTFQGKEIIENLKKSMVDDPQRNIIVLRLSYSSKGGKDTKLKNKSIYQFLSNLDDFTELKESLIVVDKSENVNIRHKRIVCESVQWSNPNYWDLKTRGKIILMVVDQTTGRSTEWACHSRIFAYHDFRNTIQYSTVSQAQERVNHYEQKYGSFQRIQIYGHVRTFKLSSGLIYYDEYLSDEWIKKKIDVRTSRIEKYRILSKADNSLHASCPEEGLDESDADRILQIHGCFCTISLSARITGTIQKKRRYRGDWIHVTPETWESVRQTDPRLSGRANPFEAAKDHILDGTWQGQHRGWKVLEWNEPNLYQKGTMTPIDLGSTGGDRIKICYQHGELGLFIATCIGMESVNTLHTSKSMYKS